MNNKKMPFIAIDFSDFDNFRTGGTLSFDRNLVKIFSPEEMLIVGYVKDDEPVGCWFKRKINNKHFSYFGICTISQIKNTKLPERFYSFIKLRKYLPIIYLNKTKNIFTQSPHFIFALKNYKWNKFCFYFAGLGNSVGLSKYKHLRFLGGIYERLLFHFLNKNADTVLAAADEKSIMEKIKKYNWKENRITKFTTRFDPKIFHPIEKNEARRELGIPENGIVLIVTGRLSYIKGWQLLIDAFLYFIKLESNSYLYLIGEGEDRKKIQNYIKFLNFKDKVILIGKVPQNIVALYLNSADIFVMGSYVEGWPTGMVEALACGKPIVTTSFSGVIEMVEDGKNGFIVSDRDPIKFAKMCQAVLSLKEASEISYKKSNKYSLNYLKNDLLSVCSYDN